MFAEICYYYPAYTMERCYNTGLPVIRSLHEKLAKIIKRDPRFACGGE